MESKIILGEEIKWERRREGILVEGICGYYNGPPQDFDSFLVSHVAGRIFDRNRASIAAERARQITDAENRYRAALDREQRLYKANMDLVEQRFNEAMKPVWKIYHEQGGRWDWDKEKGKFLCGE